MKRRFPAATLFLLLLILILLLTLGALTLLREYTRRSALEQLMAVPLQETAAAPDSSAEEAAAPSAPAADTVVAKAGSAELTNNELQIYYLNAIASLKNQGSSEIPDFSRPLAEQICPLVLSPMSWQDYFLRTAVHTWRLEQAAAYAAAQPQPITEDIFQPIPELHAEYIAEDLPVNGFLYADRDRYTPNTVHRSWLDSLPETIDSLAAGLGYRDADDYASHVFGSGVSGEDILRAAQSANLAYMYFTEKSFDAEPTDADIAGYIKAEKAAFPGRDQTVADIRHVLLIPEAGRVAENGSVTAGTKAWAECQAQAEQMLEDWKLDRQSALNADAAFARLANQNSADAGSAMNGGAYLGISRGELIDPLDKWVFAPGRIAGDTAVLRTELGIHIIYLKGFRSADSETARQIILNRRMELIVQGWLKAQPLQADYDAMTVWVSPEAKIIDPDTLLYPDIGHERFPEAITYLQQDYMYHPYGSSSVGRGGCGITTMAMLATYMTDKIYSPGYLATVYASYHTPEGTNGDIFIYVPAELGFYMDAVDPNLDNAVEALKKGQRVISLQQLGHFTRGGHYLLLQRYYEEDDTFQVRDSNVYNYGRLYGHRIDRFTRADILSGMSHNYIMQKKIVRIPCCSRCGGSFDKTSPELLLKSEYTCEKCLTALARRSAWQTLTASV